MSTFKTITSIDEVRKLAAAGLLWWGEVEPAAVAWSTHPEDLLRRCVDSGAFSVLLED